MRLVDVTLEQSLCWTQYVRSGARKQTSIRKKWSKKADMPSGFSRGSSVVFRHRIYVLGGEQNCCVSYNPYQDQWETHPKSSVEHTAPSAVVWKDRILLGGGENTSVIEEYNPDTDPWCL